MAPLDMFKNFIGFLVGFISEDAAAAIKGFSFAGLFSKMIDALVSFVKNPIAAIEKIARNLIKFPVAILAGAKAALGNLLRPSKIPAAFGEAFSSTLNSVGSGAADASAKEKIAGSNKGFNEKVAENNAQRLENQGGTTVVDSGTNIRQGDQNTSTSLTMNTEPPFDNGDFLEMAT